MAGILSTATLRLVNSIVHGNQSALGGDLQCSTYSETHVLYSCIGDIYGSLMSSNHLIRTDPLLADPANGDVHLLYGSPCIDTGSPDYSPALPDLDGEPRPFGAAIDMGADEFVDRDGDNMADYWETDQYGSTNAVSGLEDTDGDELTTFGEYMAQTDPHQADTAPRDGTSFLGITGACPDTHGLRLEWQGGSSAWQWLESCPNLASNTWGPLILLPPPTPRTNAIIMPATGNAQFYRLRAERE